MTTDDHLETGRNALKSGRWNEAVDAFETSLSSGETPEAWQGLGEALWWLGRSSDSVRCRERSYVAYREGGETVRACRMALDLSISYLINLGNPAAAKGWLARAERVVANTQSHRMSGWLWLIGGFLASDPDQGQELISRALQFARQSGDTDLELVALSDLGIAKVRAGAVDEGLDSLDEAMAGTLAGEYSRLDTVVFTSCNMLAACSLAGDLERAVQWCRVADEFMERVGSPFMYATCRAHFGGVLIEKGQWARAEQELQAALRMSQEAGPGARSEALARLADLRFRQGRLEEASSLLEPVYDSVSAALPAAALQMARGEPEVAVSQLLRRLRRLGQPHIEAPSTLAMLVDAHIATGNLDAATEVAARLGETAAAQDSPHASAVASLASGHLADAKGRTEDAIVHLEEALDQFSDLDLPFESGQVRLELARLLAQTNPEMAKQEAARALAVLDQLGASAHADAAASLLRSLGITRRPGPKNVGILTKREQEVLQLITHGLSNSEIGERLFISRKTAAHHVSRVLAKLGVRNRAEAAALAWRLEELGQADTISQPES